MLIVIYVVSQNALCAECHNAEYHYGEWHHAERRCASISHRHLSRSQARFCLVKALQNARVNETYEAFFRGAKK